MTRYEILYKEGDEVCFKTCFPDSNIQPIPVLSGLITVFPIGGLDKPKEIKGKIILIHEDKYHVLADGFVYVCKKYLLKPLVKPGEILFFEKKQVELYPSLNQTAAKEESPKIKKLAFIDDYIDVAAMVVIIILSIALGFLIGVKY